MKNSLRWILFTLLVACFIVTACAPKPPAAAKEAPAKVEEVEGSEAKRVTLTEKAAARLGIQMDTIQEAVVTRVRSVGGTVVDEKSMAAGGAEQNPASAELIPATAADRASSGDKFVSVRLSESDLSMLDQSQPARVRLTGTAAEKSDILAEPVGFEKAVADFNVPLYFKVNGGGDSLTLGQTVSVEYAMAGSGDTRRTAPYAAVLYDVKGNTWVYTSPSPLVFIRQPVVIDYIDGDRAILKDGPPVGTQIVTVGVPELFGIDTGVDK